MKSSRLVQVSDDSRLIRFDEDPKRPELLAAYRSTWEQWAQRERPARDALDIFEKLYSLHAQLQREGENYELMLGDGLLIWGRPDGNVRHHVLLQRLTLDFDPTVPQFTLYEGIQPPELYGALFRSMTDVNPVVIGESRSELEQKGWHPLGGDDTNAFLKRLAVRLHSRGQFVEQANWKTASETPLITRAPAIFLRRRTLGFSTALEGIVEQLPSRDDLPSSLLRIVGVGPQARTPEALSESSEGEASPNGEDGEILLSKPANPEQLDIARRLERTGAVLVQGPPGTGKTHTIGNLIGHLLAQGKSILVTSHTAKALKVLREQVVEPLQSLCVSVLDDSSRQLEDAIDTIADRLGSLNADQLEREAAQLQAKRIRVLSELKKARTKLSDARQSEYTAIVLGGAEYQPSQAARWVRENADKHGWIPGPVLPGATPPLATGELHELYRTNVGVTEVDERELERKLPDPGVLLAPTDFRRLVEGLAPSAEDDELDFRADLWLSARDDDGDALAAAYESLAKALQPLAAAPRWWLAAAEAGKEGGNRRQAWDDLIAQVEAVYEEAVSAQATLLKHGPELAPDLAPDQARAVAEAIVRHLQSGGQLSALTLLVHRDWAMMLRKATVNGERPATLEHFEALRLHSQLRISRRELLLRWSRQMAPLGGADASELGPEPEVLCRQYASRLRLALDWHGETLSPLEESLKEQGFRWDAFLAEIGPVASEFAELERLRKAASELLPRVIAAEIRRRRKRCWEGQIQSLRQYLDEFGKDGAEVVDRLRAATRVLSLEDYTEAFQRLVDLHQRNGLLTRRRELLSRLERTAPVWAEHIGQRKGAHGEGAPPGTLADAWLWRQLQDELERRAAVSMEELQARIDRLGEELREVTSQLVERCAWAAQLRSTTHEQQSSLMAFKQIMRRIGKGTGKRVPRLRAEARRLMIKCQSAVPVWIMPLNRVAETYDPRVTRFDVVIIDEASQADLMALIAVYMARQVVVVGDHEQVSPLAIGQRAEEVQHLIDEHLRGIPNAVLYDGRFSIYDLAQQVFQPIVLKEHFRCVRPIIEFSNHLSYNGSIKPLRDASSVLRRPHTVAYRVEGAETDNGVNEVEAVTVASLIVAAAEQPEYKNASFGAISMVGDDQARRIDWLLRQHMSFEEYDRRRVLCGNSAEFQGDERDVVFLSMVDTPSGSGPLSLRSDGSENMYRKRFNVAASRARDQLWVVYSLDPEVDLQPGDLRRRLIEHAKDPDAIIRRLERVESRVESEFERHVARRLVEAGYRVQAQRSVGAYRIDLVVEGKGGRRLAVECDGERYHPPEKLDEDAARQAVLERMDWRFFRIRGSEFFRNPEKVMDRLVSRLQSLDILPDAIGEQAEAANDGNELLERIKRRAEELRAEWAKDPGTTKPGRGPNPPPAEPPGKGQKGQPEPPQPPPVHGPRIDIGRTFVVLDRTTGERLTLVLTWPDKANIDKGLLSIASPLGKAVFSRRQGETVQVTVDKKVFEYTILAVQP